MARGDLGTIVAKWSQRVGNTARLNTGGPAGAVVSILRLPRGALRYPSTEVMTDLIFDVGTHESVTHSLSYKSPDRSAASSRPETISPDS